MIYPGRFLTRPLPGQWDKWCRARVGDVHASSFMRVGSLAPDLSCAPPHRPTLSWQRATTINPECSITNAPTPGVADEANILRQLAQAHDTAGLPGGVCVQATGAASRLLRIRITYYFSDVMTLASLYLQVGTRFNIDKANVESGLCGHAIAQPMHRWSLSGLMDDSGCSTNTAPAGTVATEWLEPTRVRACSAGTNVRISQCEAVALRMAQVRGCFRAVRKGQLWAERMAP